jgi:hypothetical protein
VILALLVGCALRRNELAELDVETIEANRDRALRSHDPTKGRAVGPGRPRGQGPERPDRCHPDLGQAGHQRLDDRAKRRRWPAVAFGFEEREGIKHAKRSVYRQNSEASPSYRSAPKPKCFETAVLTLLIFVHCTYKDVISVQDRKGE